MIKQNYEIMNELGLENIGGIIKDQETGLPMRYIDKNKGIDKIFVANQEDSNWATYEYFNPYFNFKQLKYLTDCYLNKLNMLEGRYFYTVSTVQDVNNPDFICIEARGERKEYDMFGNTRMVDDIVQSRFFEKKRLYLCYIDFICQLSGNTIEDVDLFLEGKEEY